jgi:hypothetical protein
MPVRFVAAFFEHSTGANAVFRASEIFFEAAGGGDAI